ncbi:MAG: PIN domain-containing protein [Candidatus Wallbacteria bacterium]|nr:PIN domain-containing protein [Candidatus Wallbacteria bacterium]
MKLVDLNLLLYAVNRDSPHHGAALTWWEDAVNGKEAVGLCWPVILGFLRLSTRRGLFPSPLSVEQAIGVVDGWLSQPRVRVLAPVADLWPSLRTTLELAGTAGNLTTDAHLAALAVDSGATLYSTDSDFARFSPPLKVVNPLATSV